MNKAFNSKYQEKYWSERYENQKTGWDVGYPTPPIIQYIDQIQNKDLNILIPGAGNAYEAEYIFEKGFKNIFVLDISKNPLESLADRIPSFPKKNLLLENFFDHVGTYDLIIEQTFFCSFPPLKENRMTYAAKMHQLLESKGKLAGLWFDIPLTGDLEKRPFGGTKEEYLLYFQKYFDIKVFEACYNSIPPRHGNELFGIFEKKLAL